MAPIGERPDRFYIEVDDLPVEVDGAGCVYADVVDEFGRSHTVNLTDWLSEESLTEIRKAAQQGRAEAIAYDEARR